MISLNHLIILIFLGALATSKIQPTHDQMLKADYEFFYELGYYKFSTIELKWEEAQDVCVADQAKLVVFNYEEEFRTIMSEINRRYNNTQSHGVFLGYHSLFQDGKYVTVDGLAGSKTGFSLPEPYNPTGCLAVTFLYNHGNQSENNTRFEDSDCTSPMHFVCEQELWRQYEWIRGLGYYKLHTEGRTWLDAYDACEREGAHLAIVNSASEAAALAEILARYPHLPNVDDTTVASLGFHRVYLPDESENEQQYITIYGQELEYVGFDDYSTNLTVTPIKQCGSLTRVGELILSPCNSTLAFFCER